MSGKSNHSLPNQRNAMLLKDVRLALIFKDFAAWCRTSCVGLNVAGFATAKVLREQGVDVSVFPVRHNIDIVDSIEHYNKTHAKPLTHVVISAPWLHTWDLEAMLEHFKHTKFVILSHSNVGFLQADANGMYLLRQYHMLAHKYHNLHIGGNSSKFVNWMRKSYGDDVILLPNLYPLDKNVKPKVWDKVSPLKIGAFGAVRPQKNFMTAAAAAIAIQKELGVPVEFHMSAGGEGDFGCTGPAIDQMMTGTGITVVRHPWSYWDNFIKLIKSMDLLIQVSYTESFNMVTADGISVGVPSVVSPAIFWCPEDWKAEPDDAMDVAEVGIHLLTRKKQLDDGIIALRAHNKKSLVIWKDFLDEGEKQKTNFGEAWFKGVKYIFTNTSERVEVEDKK